MKRIVLLTILIACLGVSLLTAEQTSVSKQLIFKTTTPISVKSGKTGIAAFDGFLANLGSKDIRSIKGMPNSQYYIVDLTEEPDWLSLDSQKTRFSGIEYIQPNRLSKLHLTPNDQMYPMLQHDLVQLPQAWDHTTGSNLVVVGVVDSGILREHPDLADNIYSNLADPINGVDDDGNGYIDDYYGWDFADAPEMSDIALGDYIGQDNDPTDENFHGTHVAGILGATGNNGIGVTGVCWTVKIMALRAGFRTTSGSGYLQDDDAAAAIIYAADNGCNVINMSWGDSNYSPIIADACQYAFNKGVTLVASAGNDPGPVLSYPARLSTVISVGAVNKYKNLAGFSSYGVDLDLVAPGEQILSTYKAVAPDLYFEQSGTSMSAPYVTGSIALLLSIQPGLTPEEVRARLLTSTDDLGDLGFDQYYGHGLLNTQRLIENLDPPIVQISYPFEQMGVTGSFDVIGTIQGESFHRYSVMYQDLVNKQWKNVSNPGGTSTPVFYTQAVQNDVLATFNIPEVFQEGMYLIRIIYETLQGRKYYYYRTVNFDRSVPEMNPESLIGFKRYDKQNLKYYVSAKFNEKVRTKLTVEDLNGQHYECLGAVLDSLQVWHLPDELPQGNIQIQIQATNSSNLVYESPLYPNFMNIQYSLIPGHGFTGTNVGKARVPLNKTYDFDGNGLAEYVAMDLPTSGYGEVFVYEPTAAGHIQKFQFPGNFLPLDIGNTNTAGMELLNLTGDTAKLYETRELETYPAQQDWTDTAISGGTIADYNGDNIKDLIMVKNLTSARVIQTYRRNTDGSITIRNTLSNNSTTTQRNTFVPTVIVDKLDSDTRPDILTADTDGDIMIYEILDNTTSLPIWSAKMPVANTYQLSVGDYDGNGTKDFVVGGYYRDNLNPVMNFWYFEGFTTDGNNSYRSMGSIMFNDVVSQNSISSFDLDNDGKQELILALSPSLYVLKYQDSKFVPVFYGNSFSTYQITAWKDSNNAAHFMTNAKVTEDSLAAFEWTLDAAFTGPATPMNFIAKPLNEYSAAMSWIDSGADSYKVYRKDEHDQITLVSTYSETTFQDNTLEAGKTYQYAVTAVNTTMSPSESLPTLWTSVTPELNPAIESIQMMSPYEIRLIFNQTMSSEVLNPGFYSINNGLGHPISVNSVVHNSGVQLRFRDEFHESAETYMLTIGNISGSTGVLPVVYNYPFEFNRDTVAPMIQSAFVSADKMTISILFSEPVFSTSENMLLDYILQCPANDADNSIVAVSVEDNIIKLTAHHKLHYSNLPYFVTVSNLFDAAGNVISSIHNVAKVVLDDISDLSKIMVYPNPVNVKNQQSVAFVNFPPHKTGKITIFNASGDRIYSTKIGPFVPENNSVTWRWNLTNDAKRKVSSGIYFYLIDMDGKQKRGKIALIN